MAEYLYHQKILVENHNTKPLVMILSGFKKINTLAAHRPLLDIVAFPLGEFTVALVRSFVAEIADDITDTASGSPESGG